MLKDKKQLAQTASPKASGWIPLSGFTMAEILIAMTIIGIVAAITIPQILGNTSGRSNKLMIQKTYAVLSQTLKIAQGKLEYNTSDVDRIVNKTGTGAPAIELQLSIENLLKKTLDIEFLDTKTTHAFSGKLLTLGDDGTLTRASSETAAGITVNNSGAGDKRGAIFETREGAYYIFPDKGKIDAEACTKSNPCLVYIDVNGPEPPNMLVTCANDANTGYYKWDATNKVVKYMKNSSTEAGMCSIDGMKVNDVYPVLIYGATVVPALNAVDAILTNHQ